MYDDLIDDEVRKSFPGKTDKEIYEFYVLAKSIKTKEKPFILESDLSHARIIRELGWQAFKEYLFEVTGGDHLEPDDFVALTNACTYLSEIENVVLYSALYGSAAEATSKKTVSARKKSFENVSAQIHSFEISKGI